jgi:lysophospholipase L1-like esterase
MNAPGLMKYTVILLWIGWGGLCPGTYPAWSEIKEGVVSKSGHTAKDKFVTPGISWSAESFFPADHPAIQYMGRIDFLDPKSPRFWAPGVTVRVRFKGSACRIILRDEMLYGNSHNYIGVTVDGGKAYRLETRGRQDTLLINGSSGAVSWESGIRNAEDRAPATGSAGTGSEGAVSGSSGRSGAEGAGLGKEGHLVTICKDTESGIGYLEFAGIICQGLLPAPALPSRKIECIGNSITCGTGMDLSEIPCGKGVWYDQHNAWMSYGALTARLLDAQWHLTAVSGIGLIHSCCKMTVTMPQVFDKMNQRADSGSWDFSRYQPDVVTICLGQNDGIQDSTVFCGAYVKFIGQIRSRYPGASIVCLTSPMGDARLTSVLKNYLSGITAFMNRSGDRKVTSYFYSRQYSHGCGGHPDLDEHRQIAGELTAYLRKIMDW